MHDPRIGRFFAVDPLAAKYPWYTPYQFSGNKVIHKVELEGLEEGHLSVPSFAPHIQIEQAGGLKKYSEGRMMMGGVIAAVALDVFVTKGWATRTFLIAAVGENMNAHDRKQELIAGGASQDDPMVQKYDEQIRETGYVIASGIVGELGISMLGIAGKYATKKVLNGWTVKQAENFAYNVKTFGDDAAVQYSKGSISREQAAAMSGGLCFAKGTQIKTVLGYTQIENIEVGDSVWSYNDKSKNFELKEVLQLFVTDSVKQLVRLKVKSNSIEVTPNHLFYIQNVWVKAKDLILGVEFTLYDSSRVQLLEKTLFDTLATVYNFEVSQNHNYFVSFSNILVHNDGCAVPTIEFIQGGGQNARKMTAVIPKGYKPVASSGKGKVFSNGKKFISPDLDGHNGGMWKVASKEKSLWKKETRTGTYNADLKQKLGD